MTCSRCTRGSSSAKRCRPTVLPHPRWWRLHSGLSRYRSLEACQVWHHRRLSRVRHADEAAASACAIQRLAAATSAKLASQMTNRCMVYPCRYCRRQAGPLRALSSQYPPAGAAFQKGALGAIGRRMDSRARSRHRSCVPDGPPVRSARTRPPPALTSRVRACVRWRRARMVAPQF